MIEGIHDSVFSSWSLLTPLLWNGKSLVAQSAAAGWYIYLQVGLKLFWSNYFLLHVINRVLCVWELTRVWLFYPHEDGSCHPDTCNVTGSFQPVGPSNEQQEDHQLKCVFAVPEFKICHGAFFRRWLVESCVSILTIKINQFPHKVIMKHLQMFHGISIAFSHSEWKEEGIFSRK